MRALFAAFILFSLGACTSLFSPISAVEGVSAVSTGKTFSDHIVSYASGKDCSTVRTNNGRTYCQENEPNPKPKVWCYRTIGKPVCYDRPDPYQGNQRKMGDNDHNLDTAP
ncbi:MAG: hypothetical protein HOL66_08400 [Rhodospirillaceae bacterium]|jgi:hypothetical protein|nr:hypothetical protein [Rhodospirillaceae bacterium]MBT5244253.1 hypothetical protein [Rhodospirillaceae bacterium]MBT5561778.1 hypothetical protein [Rhodospirillaceae bacterium]MBT6243217.1 hypothetical protein [Rhodospirillaceae bacterium]